MKTVRPLKYNSEFVACTSRPQEIAKGFAPETIYLFEGVGKLSTAPLVAQAAVIAAWIAAVSLWTPSPSAPKQLTEYGEEVAWQPCPFATPQSPQTRTDASGQEIARLIALVRKPALKPHLVSGDNYNRWKRG